MNRKPAQRYALWLWLLLVVFAFRVLAQPLTLLVDTRYLPPFESWHSGVMPYPALLATQLLIIAWLSRTSYRFSVGEVRPNHRLGIWMLAFGGCYFTLMLLRFVLGVTLLSGQRWFASPLPTFFHLVLAAFIILYGHYHFHASLRNRLDAPIE